MLNPAGIEPGLGQAGSRDPVPPPNPSADCQAAAGRGRLLSGPGLRTKRAALPHLAEPFVVLVLIVGTAVAAWVHLRSSSIWYDEAVTLLITSGHAKLEWSRGLSQFTPSAHLGKILIDLYHRDVHPPLYFWTLALWRVLLGESLEVARALSVLFTVATLALIYRYAKSAKVRLAWVPVLVYAVSSVGIRYAYNARPYAMVSFLIVLALILARSKSRWTGACAGACVATHYFAALCIVPLLAVSSAEQWKANRRWVLLTAITFGLFCAPQIVLLRVHIAARPQQYPGFTSLYEESCALLNGAIGGAMPHSWLSGWGLVLLLGACLAVLGAWWAYNKREFLVPLSYAAFLCGFLLLAMTTNKSLTKMPTEYYLGVGTPFLALLIGFGASALPRAMPVLAVLLLAGAFTATPITHTTDYRKMLAEMRSKCSECPIVVGVGYMGAIPACVLYEAKGMRVLLLGSNDTVGQVVRRVDDQQNIFMIPANEPATAHIEQRLVEAYPSRSENGYFEIRLTRGGSSDSFTRMSRLSKPSVYGSPTWLLVARQLSER